jgi:hypothetical protein
VVQFGFVHFAPRSSVRDLSEFAANNFDKVDDKVEDKVSGTGVHSWLKECFCPIFLPEVRSRKNVGIGILFAWFA